MKNIIDWPSIYAQPALFHIYLTERRRGKTDTKAWSLLEQIISDDNICFAWIRRRWHDSLECSRPYFQDEVYKFCEKKGLRYSSFEIYEKGVFYHGKRRIYFFDLFGYQRARGAIARTEFKEIIYEEAIPIDQEFLYVGGRTEQWMFHDLIGSLKGRRGKDGEKLPLKTKITFLANPYMFSAWFLDVFKNLNKLRKEAEQKKEIKDNSGVLEIVKDEKDVEWLLYLNLIEGENDPHSSALEEKLNPSLVNWDDYMIDEPKKYKISLAIQDFYFCEIGERQVFKKYCLMHFSKNKKETDSKLTNFCFDLEEKAKSKIKRSVIKEKSALISKWVKMLKGKMLYFRDYRSRDWFIEQLKVKTKK